MNGFFAGMLARSLDSDARNGSEFRWIFAPYASGEFAFLLVFAALLTSAYVYWNYGRTRLATRRPFPSAKKQLSRGLAPGRPPSYWPPFWLIHLGDAVAFLLLALLLVRPAINYVVPHRNKIVVAIDDSASMVNTLGNRKTTTNGNMEASRLGGAIDALWGSGRWIQRLSRQYDVELVSAADGAPISQDSLRKALTNPKPVSRVAESLNRILDGANRGASRLQGVLLVSDGLVNGGPDLSQAANEWERLNDRETLPPVCAICLGPLTGPPIARISYLDAPSEVYPNEVFTIRVATDARDLNATIPTLKLTQTNGENTFAPDSADDVSTALKNSPSFETASTVLSTNSVLDGPAQHAVQITAPDDGVVRITAQISSAGLASTESLTAETNIQVRKEPLRVLLVQGPPTYESRFLAAALMRTPGVACQLYRQTLQTNEGASKHVLPPDLYSDEGKAVFDVLLLADADPELLGRQWLQSANQFVQDGGGLALIAGRYIPSAYVGYSVDPWFPMEIARGGKWLQESFQPAPVNVQAGGAPADLIGTWAAGEGWRRLAPWQRYYAAEELKANSIPIVVKSNESLQEEPVPIVTLHAHGLGRVAFQAGDETWRWRRLAGDAVMLAYWTPLLRGLAGRGETPRLELSGTRAAVGEPVSIRLLHGNDSFDDPSRELRVTEPDGRETLLSFQSNDANRQEQVFTPRTTGTHQVEVVGSIEIPPLAFEAVLPNKEAMGRVNIAGLARAAEAAGGAWLASPTFESISAILESKPLPHATVQRQSEVVSSGSLLTVLLALLCLGWYTRRMRGLS